MFPVRSSRRSEHWAGSLARTSVSRLGTRGAKPIDCPRWLRISSTRPGGNHYDGTALTIAKTLAEMSRFGIEPRHLRAFKAAADREVGLVEQVVTPLVRQRNPEARARAEEVARELASLSVRLHAALVKAGLRPGLSR